MRISFLNSEGTVLNVFKLGTTSNKKIARKGEQILQTYHFDIAQVNFIANGGKGINLRDGFLQPSLTANNCGSCPLRFGGCYTFKFSQAMGHKGMLNSIVNEYPNLDFPKLNDKIKNTILGMLSLTSKGYIRFGSYGCPTNIQLDLVKELCNNAQTWSGYTHEWHNESKTEYLDYFMASAHNKDSIFASELANAYGFRTFETDSTNGIYCPSDKGVNCSDCGLCSGRKGKGKTNIVIATH